MSNPFLGEIRMVGFNFAPYGWMFCSNQLLPVNQYEALYTLLGTTYGGDGVTTFALPDFRGRVPLNQGQGPGLTNRVLGQNGGTETVTLTLPQLPLHGHSPVANNIDGHVDAPATTAMPARPVQPSGGNSATLYTDPTMAIAPADYKPMQAGLLTPAGQSQSHDNLAPFLTVNFIIAVEGVFPSRN